MSASYRAAAAVNGLLLPAGEALRAVRAEAPSISLFEADGFHPSVAGTYAAALVIYARAAEVSPIGLTARAGGSSLPPGYVTALEAGAAAMQRDAGVPAVAVYVVEAIVILVVVLADAAKRRA